MRIALVLPAALLGALAYPLPAAAQEQAWCLDAHRFLTGAHGMAAEVEPDSVDDWRTGQVTAGCRVTAAGLTRATPRGAARALFAALRAAGWVRSPEPRDSPNEASLRFRREGADCLFSFYTGGLLGTDAEFRVDDARVPAPGQRRFNVLVLCVPAAPAKPRLPPAGRVPAQVAVGRHVGLPLLDPNAVPVPGGHDAPAVRR